MPNVNLKKKINSYIGSAEILKREKEKNRADKSDK